MSAKRGTASKSLSEGMFPGRRRGRKPRRVEEIQSQESDSSPASSPTRRPRGRPMRRGTRILSAFTRFFMVTLYDLGSLSTATKSLMCKI